MGGGEMLAADGRPNVIAGDRMKPAASQHAVKKFGREHAHSGPPQGPDLRAVPAADGELQGNISMGHVGALTSTNAPWLRCHRAMARSTGSGFDRVLERVQLGNQRQATLTYDLPQPGEKPARVLAFLTRESCGVTRSCCTYSRQCPK
jgi:hypothetical protein